LLLDIADSVTQPTPDFDNVIAWDKKWKTSRPLVPSINKTITKLTKMDSYIQMRTTITMISEHHQMTNPSLSHGGLVLTLKQIDGTYLEVQANIQLSQHLLDCIDHTVNQDNVGSQSEETHLSINPLGLYIARESNNAASKGRGKDVQLDQLGFDTWQGEIKQSLSGSGPRDNCVIAEFQFIHPQPDRGPHKARRTVKHCDHILKDQNYESS
ncbi:hypothetical protein X801_00735, partial [Opisthorchis viverrini]